MLCRAGHQEIIDLSSPTAVEILKCEILPEEFDQITAVSNIEPIILSDYAEQLSKALENCPLSLFLLREALYENGFKKGFDSIVHFDASFVEVTIRYL